MTAQEVYDRLFVAAYDGTFPSGEMDDAGVFHCRYRGDLSAGCKQRCAAGILLPDDKYNPEMDRILGENDGYPASSPEVLCVMDVPGEFTPADIIKLQFAHDDIARSEEGWDGDKFVRKINLLRIFDKVVKKYPGDSL